MNILQRIPIRTWRVQLPYAVRDGPCIFGLLTAAQRLIDNGTPSMRFAGHCRNMHSLHVLKSPNGRWPTPVKPNSCWGRCCGNQRIRTMCEEMSSDREGASFAPPRMYCCIDNGTMIALLGWLELKKRTTSLEQSAIDQYLRTDQTPIVWS